MNVREADLIENASRDDEPPFHHRLKSRELIAWLSAGLYAILAIALYLKHVERNLRMAFAKGQVRIFQQMCERCRDADAESCADYLSYALHYYPSGTKQRRGSSLDEVVETARQWAVNEMIAELRRKTGEDLGNDPVKWIDKYASQ